MRTRTYGSVAAVLCCVLLTGCTWLGIGGSSDAQSTSPIVLSPVQESNANALTGTLTVCIEEQFCDDAWPIWGELQAFAAENPQLTLRYEKIISPYDQGMKEDRTLAREAQISQIETNLMTGTGPDVFLLGTSCTGDYKHLFGDLNKLMRGGAFCDITPYLSTPLQADSFYMNVMEAGQYSGAQYIVPLSFSVPLMLSETALLDKVGFERAAAARNITVFRAELNRVMAANPERKARAVWDDLYCLQTPMLDYDAKTVRLGEPVFREAFAAKQLLCDAPWNLLITDYVDVMRDIDRMMQGEQLFRAESTNIFLMEGAQRMQALGGQPEFIGIPTEAGGYAATVQCYGAVGAASQSKEAAGALLSALLSKEAQSANAFCGGAIDFPVRRGSLASSLETDRTWAVQHEQLTNAHPLSEETLRSLTDTMEQIQYTHLQFYYGDAIRLGDKTLTEYFLPYENEVSDYDTLLDAVMPKLTLYLQE